jgi:hypothetical protein
MLADADPSMTLQPRRLLELSLREAGEEPVGFAITQGSTLNRQKASVSHRCRHSVSVGIPLCDAGAAASDRVRGLAPDDGRSRAAYDCVRTCGARKPGTTRQLGGQSWASTASESSRGSSMWPAG